MFNNLTVGDKVAVNAIIYQVARVSQSRFWLKMGEELVKFNRSNGREYGGRRQAELPLFAEEASAEEPPALLLCDSDARSMSAADLLAGVLQTPDADQLAHKVLASFDSMTMLRRATAVELARVVGSLDLANRIKAAIEFSRRLLEAQDVERPKVQCPGDAADMVMADMRDLRVEHLRLILLDTRNNVLGAPTVYIGSLNSLAVRQGDIFRHALERNAAAMIVVHNHPSGDANPSPEDIAVTRQLVAAGKLLDISVLDHLVIGDGRFVSLKERGLGFD